MDAPEPNPRAKELGRKAARFVKAFQPDARGLASRARPQAEKAGRNAVGYARAHEGEIKQTAANWVRRRLRGPFGLFMGALTSEVKAKSAGKAVICPRCQAANPGDARFCNHCGLALPPSAPS